MAPVHSGGGKLTSGLLGNALVRDFGSFDDFKKVFNTKTASIQGSGWGWLVRFCFVFLRYVRELIRIYVRDMISFRGNSKL